MRFRMRLGTFATVIIGLIGFVGEAGAQDRYIRGKGLSARTYTTAGAAELTLETGATVDNAVLAANPGDDEMFRLFDTTLNQGSSNWSNVGMFVTGSQTGHVFVDTNGYIIFARGDRRCAGLFQNRDLRSSPCNAHIMAPFWDDLVPVSGTSTITYGATSGTFWYVQWNDFALASAPSARVTFRATYYNSGEGVRFNYISMTGTGSDGTGASVGVHSCPYPDKPDRPEQFVSFGFNEAVIRAPMAIEISRDNDRDHVLSLNDPDDNDPDDDNDSVTDGGEIAAGTNPQNAASTPALTDTDADGLVDVDENFFGTNLNAADSDNDGINDGPEIFTVGTDPMLADSDGDGYDDGDEDKDADGNVDGGIEGEGDPLDEQSVPGIDLSQVDGSVEWHNVQMVIDDDGNAHIAGTGDPEDFQNGLYYWLVRPDGTMGIQGTRFEPISRTLAYPHLRVQGSVVTIIYEALGDEPSEDQSTSSLGYIRFDVSAHALDNTRLEKYVTSVTHTNVQVGGAPRYYDMALNSLGETYLFYQDKGTTQVDDTPQPKKLFLAKVSRAGVLASLTEIVDYPRFGEAEGEGTGDGHLVGGIETGESGRLGDAWDGTTLFSNHGIHKHLSPELIIDSNDAVHMLWNAVVAPDDQDGEQDDLFKYATGMYYARFDTNGVRGPAYVTSGQNERIDMIERDGLIYFTGTNGDLSGDGDGVRLGILDVRAISFIPRVNDQFGAKWALSPQSFLRPYASVFQDDEDFSGASIDLTPNGNIILAYTDRSDPLWITVVTPQGESLAQYDDVLVGNQESNEEQRHKPVKSWGDGIAVLNEGFNEGELSFGSLRAVPDPVASPLPRRPFFTSTAPGGNAVAGRVFSYQAGAEDDVSAPTSLTWTLVASAPNATLSASGLFQWTPTPDQAGDWLVGIGVCDEVGLCSEQFFVLTVTTGSAPRIVSNPPSSVFVGNSFEYAVGVEDADLPNDSHSYTLTTGPAGAGVNTQGVITWSPGEADVGSRAFIVTVTDGSGSVASQAFTVNVSFGGEAATGDAPPAITVRGGGCAQSNGLAWPMALVLVPLLLQGRRRRRS